MTIEQLRRRWPSIVGAYYGAHTSPRRIDHRGVLTISASAPISASETFDLLMRLFGGLPARIDGHRFADIHIGDYHDARRPGREHENDNRGRG